VVDQEADYSIIDCQECGFKHLNPVPSPEELNEFYKGRYYETCRPDTIREDHDELEHRQIAYDERLAFIGRNTEGRDLLDIGCGAGFFLARAREFGWNCLGLEPSESASRLAAERNLQVFNLTLDEFLERYKMTFDVIHLKNVLEHIPQPAVALRKCRNLLNAGGLLYVEVPNDYNLLQRTGVRMVNERKHWICIPDHVNYFDFRTAVNLVKNSGFKLLRRDTTFPMYLFLLLGQNFVREKTAGTRVHLGRVRLELFLKRYKLSFLKRLIYTGLAHLGLGRTVILYCRKSDDLM
jgi:SAM-dependent methyltransferase